MTIKEVFRREKVNVRTRNMCKVNEIKSVRDLQLHYDEYGSFKNLRHCGNKCNEELIAICNKYKDMYIEDEKNQLESVKRRQKLEDVVTDLDEVLRTTQTRDVSFEEIEQNLKDHWEKKGIRSVKSEPKVSEASKSIEEIEQMLKDHWEKKGISSVKSEPKVSEAPRSLEEIEQMLKDHWKESK